jgi:allophanate hydrolase subunit 2
MVTVGYLAKRGPARHIRLADLPGGSGPFRVVPLPESPIAFPSRPLHLSPRSDRTGTRCLPSAGFRHDVERPSQPCDRGHIQVTRHGELIVLGPDGPTIGGYPRLGALIRADWGRIARAGWADPIEFCPTTWNDAAHLGHEHQLRLTDLARQWAVTLGN